ncbi:MAG: hypothetical protein WCF84_17965 [Anaerolineae bacterium]
MNIEQLERRLEWWKRVLFLTIGVCLTLLIWALTEIPDGHMSTHLGWYLIWLIAQVLVTPAGFVMLGTKDWQRLALPERLNTAFGYLAIAWFLFCSFIVKTNQDNGNPGGLAILLLYGLVLSVGLTLVLTYRALSHSRRESPEEMFP